MYAGRPARFTFATPSSSSRNRGTDREKVRYIEPYAGCFCEALAAPGCSPACCPPCGERCRENLNPGTARDSPHNIAKGPAEGPLAIEIGKSLFSANLRFNYASLRRAVFHSFTPSIKLLHA